MFTITFIITWLTKISLHNARNITVCFVCLCSVEKYRKCEPLAASSNTKAVDPLINLDSKKKPLSAPLSVLALCFLTFLPFLFDLVISVFQVKDEIIVCLCLAGNSPDFKAGVTALSNILKIQRHDDYLVMLKVGVRSHSLCVLAYFHFAFKFLLNGSSCWILILCLSFMTPALNILYILHLVLNDTFLLLYLFLFRLYT